MNPGQVAGTSGPGAGPPGSPDPPAAAEFPGRYRLPPLFSDGQKKGHLVVRLDFLAERDPGYLSEGAEEAEKQTSSLWYAFFMSRQTGIQKMSSKEAEETDIY